MYVTVYQYCMKRQNCEIEALNHKKDWHCYCQYLDYYGKTLSIHTCDHIIRPTWKYCWFPISDRPWEKTADSKVFFALSSDVYIYFPSSHKFCRKSNYLGQRNNSFFSFAETYLRLVAAIFSRGLAESRACAQPARRRCGQTTRQVFKRVMYFDEIQCHPILFLSYKPNIFTLLHVRCRFVCLCQYLSISERCLLHEGGDDTHPRPHPIPHPTPTPHHLKPSNMNE